ncbi:hypothetical protein SAY87_027234 [Trapa incisa]|uniref:Cyclin-D6-1 n=1 Tax=Trapa incisa TaxID=236973 RepID=A0AAN7JM97_9MYRT|nr:hypothetical protein SAY87_027234 [Trapa incisa]
MDFDLENPFTDSGDCLCADMASLLRAEADHMLSEAYVKSLKLEGSDFIVRKDAIFSISKICCRFDPALPYLAVNYLDRFLSEQSLQKPKPWAIRLLAVSCVSLSAKMQKTEFSLPCLQAACGIIFDVQTIERMEMLILGALKWRMRSITPFSFVSFFIPLFKLEHPASRQALKVKARASEIIFKAQNGVKLLEFKPSDIAASALLSAAHDLFPFKSSDFQSAILGCSFVNKECVASCCSAMQEALMDEYSSAVNEVSSSDTPMNVLDLQLSVSECGDSTGTGASMASGIAGLERLPKRRRMEGELMERPDGPNLSFHT